MVAAQSNTESYFLAFLVGLHVATALVLLVFYRKEWIRIIRGFFSSARKRKITNADERLSWLLLIATIPAGLIGLIFEHKLRVIFAKPMSAAIFLVINGMLLLLGERMRKHARGKRDDFSVGATTYNLSSLDYKDAALVGVGQILALFAGISRSGVTMVGGLWRGLDNEDAARFSFLLATPIILAAGVYKLHDLVGPNGAGIRGQILAGSIAAGLAAYVAVRFLDKFFRTNSLKPFAIYCLVFGALMIAVIH